MKPLSALIRLQLGLKNGGICVVFRSLGWHNTGGEPPKSHTEAKGAAGSGSRNCQARGGGGQAWALCPKSLFGRPSLPWLQACLAHDCHKTLSIEGGGLLAAPSSLFILFIASLIGFCLCFPLPADCDSYCKASKGKLKINMKKYCKKDYGE